VTPMSAASPTALGIGALSRATGVSPRSLRYYQQVGLLDSDRDQGGRRRYRSAAVDRVILIQHLFAAGLCSAGIADLLPCLEAPPELRTDWLRTRLLDDRTRLLDQRRDLDRAVDTLDEILAGKLDLHDGGPVLHTR
jgi:DNA-binding transcriptional MerR regulator